MSNNCENEDHGESKMQSQSTVEKPKGTQSEMDQDGNINVQLFYNADCYKCCICYDNIIGHIFSCEHNHSTCQSCHISMSAANNVKCPVCRTSVRGRNHILEKIMLKYIAGCENKRCLYKNYAGAIREHMKQCDYSTIKCIWCDKKVTPRDIGTHAEFDCEMKFSQVSCSDKIDFIKSDSSAKNIVIDSLSTGLSLYIEKTDNEYNFVCIQTNHSHSDLEFINLSYSILFSAFDFGVSETCTVRLPVHRSSDLIDGKIYVHAIPNDKLKTYTNITVSGLTEKFEIGSKWSILDKQKSWYDAKIVSVKYGPYRVLFKFDKYPRDKYDEWVNIKEEASYRIRPRIADRPNSGLSDMEMPESVHRRIGAVSEEELLKIVMERSMDEQ